MRACCSYGVCARLAHIENCCALKRSFIEPIKPYRQKQPLPILKDPFLSKNTDCYISATSLWQWQGNQCWPSFRELNDNTGGGWESEGAKEKRKINSSFSAFLYRDSDVCWDKGRQAWEISCTISTWTTMKLLLCPRQFKSGKSDLAP